MLDILLPRISYLSLPAVAFDICFIDSATAIILPSVLIALGAIASVLGAFAVASVTAETNALDVWYFVVPIIFQMVGAAAIILVQTCRFSSAGND